MKSLFMTLLISILFLTGCGNSKVYVGAEAGPVDITVAVDNNGKISVSGGVAPKFKVGLGPIELKVGIQQTLELTKESPFTLFVIWENEDGEIQREEYEIGKSFHVRFTQNELVQEIRGDNNSVVVAVKKPNSALPTSPPSVQTEFPDIYIVPSAERGVVFTAQVDGNYQFTIKDNIYCWNSGQKCRSIIRGYLNRNIEWALWYNMLHPMNQDYELGCWENDTAVDKNCAVGHSTIVNMKAQDYIKWVVMEEKGSSSYNTGNVLLGVKKLP